MSRKAVNQFLKDFEARTHSERQPTVRMMVESAQILHRWAAGRSLRETNNELLKLADEMLQEQVEKKEKSDDTQNPGTIQEDNEQ